MKHVIELTRGYKNREIVSRVEIDCSETREDKSQVLAEAFALVRSPENPADGFRVFNDQGRLRASAWLGTNRDDDSH